MTKNKAFAIGRATIDTLHPDTVSHFHQNGHFVLMVKGSRQYDFQNSSITIQAEDGLYINPNVLHTGLYANCDYIWLNFNEEIICADEKMRQKFIDPVLAKADYIHLHKNIPWQNDILNTILQLYMYKSAKAEDLDLIAYHSFYTIFHLLYSNIPLVEENVQDTTKVNALRTMMTYIETHFHEQIHLEDIARSANISNSGCSALFQELIHDSPYHYVLTFRLEKARTLLYETTNPVSDIAYQCGFLDTSHFTKVFRETFGITPAAYRRQLRN